MHSPVRRGGLRRVAAVVVALLLLVGGALASFGLDRPRYDKRGYVHRVRAGKVLYTFDAAWRQEALHTLAGPGAPAPDPAYLDRLRAVLLHRLGCGSLEDVPVEGKAEMDAVRSLGYL